MTTRLRFDLPRALEAGEPPEARGLTRDAVRMMVAYRADGRVVDSTFSLLASFLEPDDLLVVNTSGTLPAAVRGVDPATGSSVVLHLSAHLGADRWVVEPRVPAAHTTERWPTEAHPPQWIALGEDGAHFEFGERYGGNRLWTGRLLVPGSALTWLTVNGRPIRYGYVERLWPLAMYQNVYATEPGSAEMPSAGRPFTAEMVTRLVAKGVGIAPVVLHTGVASLEADELPYPERVRVPPFTARRVNATRETGGRVIAVGTTSVRALESAYDPHSGTARSVDGWTELVVTPRTGVRVVDGLLTGWHEPEASHLLMLEAIAGRPLLEQSYSLAVSSRYLWHEFGDVHLVLP